MVPKTAQTAQASDEVADGVNTHGAEVDADTGLAKPILNVVPQTFLVQSKIRHSLTNFE